jgi:FkbM family methyltransferase
MVRRVDSLSGAGIQLARKKQILIAPMQRLWILVRKVFGLETDLTWCRLLKGIASDLQRIGGEKHSCIIFRQRTGNFLKLITLSGEEIYWPPSMETETIECVYRELSNPDHPHQYFSLYSPSPNDVVFDIGACEGMFAYRLRNLVSRLFLFEPVPQIADALCMTFSTEIASGKVQVIQKALGDTDRKVEMSIQSSFLCSSNIETPVKDIMKAQTIQVTTIDSFIEENMISRIDLIKIDAEGSEISILKGALKTMQTLHPRFLITLYHKPEDAYQIPAFFEANGYVIIGKTYNFFYRGWRGRHYRLYLILAARRENTISTVGIKCVSGS